MQVHMCTGPDAYTDVNVDTHASSGTDADTDMDEGAKAHLDARAGDSHTYIMISGTLIHLH